MKSPGDDSGSKAEISDRPGIYQRFIRSGPVVVAAACILLLTIGAAALAPYLAPHDPLHTDLRNRCQPPLPFPGSGTEHPLGTDHLGRDILSRIIYGSRVSLVVGVGAVSVAGLAGVFLGLLSGYYGGWVDTVIMRLTDVFLAIPFLLLGMAVVALLGASILNLVLVLGITRWTAYARIIRGQALCVREKEFVLAGKACGFSWWRIMFRHVLPNVFSPVIVIATLELANMIIYESGLSFLGLGIEPPTPTWGNMLNDGRDYMMTAWWLATLPGLAIFAVVVTLNVLGDWLRDVLDPSLRT